MTQLNENPPGALAVAGLRSDLSGEVIGTGDPGYEEARALFNGMIDLRPRLIAQCASADDVARAISFGREHGLEISVRGGGHSVAGMALTEGGIVVDLRRMDSVRVDPEASTALVGGGATMSRLDRASQPFGLVTTGGRVSTTGVGGFTLGGGSGWIERKYGLACDNLIEVELVTADGSTARASAEENPELFWALHGGGGNFGVATSFAFRLHPLASVTAALLLWPPEAGPEVARAYRDYMDAAPDEVGGALLYLVAPPEEFVPGDLVGRLACAVFATYTGGEAPARDALRPLLDLGHTGGLVMELPYADMQCMLDDPAGFRNYWSVEHLAAFPDEAVDAFCARARTMLVPSGTQHLAIRQGGAVSRVKADYPVPWRAAPWAVHPFAVWEDPADDERSRRWVHDVRADLRPWSTGAVYLNFTGDEGQERLIAGLGADNYRRLARIKADYDPENVFHRNHNIAPGRVPAQGGRR